MKRFTAVILFTAIVFSAGPACSQEPGYAIEGYAYGDIYFDTLSAELSDKAMTELEGLSRWMREHPGSVVLLAGYDDQRTQKDRSIELGLERVNAVRDYLISLGADAKDIKAISFGNTKVALPGGGEEVWFKNRRVRYRVVPTEEEATMEGRPSGVCQKCKK